MKTRCEGLAPGLFLFAILGNATYALSILVVSIERNYLIRNASWLAGTVSETMMKRDVLTGVVGSTLTIFLDLIVRVVIHMFLGYCVRLSCVRYFVSSSITGLCRASGAGLMERVSELWPRVVMGSNPIAVSCVGMKRTTLLPRCCPSCSRCNFAATRCCPNRLLG